MSAGKELPLIEIIKPDGKGHPAITAHGLQRITDESVIKSQSVPLIDFMRQVGNKERVGKPHLETFIVSEGEKISSMSVAELNDLFEINGMSMEIIGLSSFGNEYQMVTAMAHGVNWENLKTAHERPVTAEGSHMILAPYAIDKKGELHLFRTLQIRNNKAMIDTARGFADAEARADGTQMYQIEGSEERVAGNLKRIVKEEGGEKFLAIKKITYLGAPFVNSTFVTSQSAFFAVELDYDHFKQLNSVVDAEEATRRKEQFEHEGQLDVILDMTLEEYVAYKNDPEINRDLAADGPMDILVIGMMLGYLQKQEELLGKRTNRMVEFARRLKKKSEN